MYNKEKSLKWTLTLGTENVALNNTAYTRSVIIENVNRCLDIGADGARNIASSTVCSPATNYVDDPSTQKITVTVSWTGGNPITVSEYVFRWKNKACKQTDWSGLYASGDMVLSCGSARFDTVDSAISTSTGTLKLE